MDLDDIYKWIRIWFDIKQQKMSHITSQIHLRSLQKLVRIRVIMEANVDFDH